jgi:hypothetical protein
MHARSVLVLALIAGVLGTPAMAQPSAAPASKAATTALPAQPALAALVEARGPQLAAAGIQRIVARTGKQRRDLQVSSRYGPIYFGWPKGVKPVTFELDVGSAGAVSVRAEGAVEADKALYAAAFDAVIPEAIRLARDARARAERPRP